MSADVPAGSEAISQMPEQINLTHEDVMLAEAEARYASRETTGQVIRGAVLFAGAAAVSGVIWAGYETNWKFSMDVPFSPTAQQAVESVDVNLAALATILTPAGLAALGGAKALSKKYPRIAEADRESSKELTNDGKGSPALPRRLLQNYASGWVPVTAATGVALSSIMAGVGYEISEGPSRPIEAMYGSIPGNHPLSLITQDKYASPMTESNVTRELTGAVIATAQEHGYGATAADLFLPTIDYNGQNYTSLVIAFPQEKTSDIAFSGKSQDCNNVPVEVDKSSDIPVTAHIKINGVNAKVVSRTSDVSAINRVGVKMDREAVAACLDKNPQAPDYMALVEADTATTSMILTEAEAKLPAHETAAVLSEQDYVDNSVGFWTANSKPITNSLAAMGGVVALLSMGGTSLAGLLRNKRNWAANLAQGVSVNQLRLTELLRATKNGVAASIFGTAASFAAPAINFLEEGLRVSVDIRTILVGCAVGMLGSVGGSLTNLIHPNKVIHIDEDTR